MKTTNSNFMNQYRNFIRGKFRIYVGWLAVIAVLLSIKKEPNVIGLSVAFLGMFLRMWAAGFIHKDKILSTKGPYSLARNPLYLGSYLLLVGISIMVENIFIFILLSAIFLSIYHFIIDDEEKKLSQLFPNDFANYLEKTPRFFPTPKSIFVTIKEFEYGSFNFKQMIHNKEYNSFIGIMVFYVLAFAKVYLMNYIK